MAYFKPLPSIDRLKEIFVIDESSPSGLRTKSARSGPGFDRIAGAASFGGYWKVMLDGVFYKVHRIIYAMHHETDPGCLVVDHINRNKQDNRVENLRLLSHQLNGINARLYSHNTIGERGVSAVRRGSVIKFRARITVNGECLHLGYFETREEARKAREAAECRLFEGQL
jgi:hypothetical protein